MLDFCWEQSCLCVRNSYIHIWTPTVPKMILGRCPRHHFQSALFVHQVLLNNIRQYSKRDRNKASLFLTVSYIQDCLGKQLKLQSLSGCWAEPWSRKYPIAFRSRRRPIRWSFCGCSVLGGHFRVQIHILEFCRSMCENIVVKVCLSNGGYVCDNYIFIYIYINIYIYILSGRRLAGPALPHPGGMLPILTLRLCKHEIDVPIRLHHSWRAMRII